MSHWVAVNWSGRIIREDKKGYIPSDIPPILDRLEIDPDLWSEHLCGFKDNFDTVIGPIEKLKEYCKRIKKKWVWGQGSNASFYSRPT